MKLHEYQAKTIFAANGIAIPRGRVAETKEQARDIATELRGRVVVKAQVLVGGRGKAGGVKVADTPAAALVWRLWRRRERILNAHRSGSRQQRATLHC